ncbi:pseudaminic acid cytidylyltransferase [Pseudomonas sp. 008]|uniref:pseudaminic acid cytidylyltransferase n=1 Tax=Pseudomonas sp. 008 TaxID=2803906 RepID=UPI00194E9157|nr:pseudaminic acid cytidylyltransferase [Pseudomonas sp. 008]GID07529.1 pseudaminic acid cytidylyltransferase [Pseudomonas sp. 008]
MTNAPTAVAIITARGGSKRIPRKNIRSFRGRPMIAWSIEAALESGAFDTVMVSTDDTEIAEIARALGAEVPFLRSAATADDHATTSQVLLEVLGQYREAGVHFDLACCLYPTAPFVRPRDLTDGRVQLLGSRFNVIMPVAAFSYPVWRSLQRGDDGRIVMNFPENLNARSQDLPVAYHDAGQWYWFRTEAFVRDHVLMGPNTGSIVLPTMQVQDIDTEEDWALAELKHEGFFYE